MGRASRDKVKDKSMIMPAVTAVKCFTPYFQNS